MKDVAVIGGGAAGMMAALTAAKEGAHVTLIEKNEKLGKKIYITGKGRCNVTNTCKASDYFDNVPTNSKFLYSAVRSFDNNDLCAFFEDAGLKLKVERGGRVFPVSEKASDITKVLKKECEKEGVTILLDTEVEAIDKSFKTKNDKKLDISADSVVIATGGLSYPSTGSCGDGYRFAESLGHNIIEPIPSLTPLVLKEKDVKDLEGLSLRNVNVNISDKNSKKILFEEFGEMLFTKDGASGPVILKASSFLGRQIWDLSKCDRGMMLDIDLKPALDKKQLDARILRDFESNKNKEIKNALSKLLPAKMIPYIIKRSGISFTERINNITKEQRNTLLNTIKKLTFEISGLSGFDMAVITKGGVDVKNINPKTMESKIAKNIYFAGEVMDVDAYTGGFNLQLAFSTGKAAGLSAGKEEHETDSDRWTCRCRKKHNS